MILVLILIENLIISRFMALKSKFDVKRNLPIKFFYYSRGKHRSDRELSRRIVEIASYRMIKRKFGKIVLLRLNKDAMSLPPCQALTSSVESRLEAAGQIPYLYPALL